MSLPKLITPSHLSEILLNKHGVAFSADELEGFARDGLMSHYLIKGGKIMFREETAKNWIHKNMLELVHPISLPSVVNVFSPRTGRAMQTVPAPEELSLALEHLSEFPSQVFRRFPCVYFLVLRGRVVYVGSSTWLAQRIAAHLENKEFDRLFFIRTPRDKMFALESQFIRLLKPGLNSEALRNRGGTPDRTEVSRALSALAGPIAVDVEDDNDAEDTLS